MKKKQMYNKNNEIVHLISEIQMEEEKRFKKDPVKKEIYEYAKQKLALDDIKENVITSMRIVKDYDEERSTHLIKVFSNITMPFVVILTVLQSGILKVRPLFRFDDSDRVISLIIWLGVIAFIVLVLLYINLFPQKRVKMKHKNKQTEEENDPSEKICKKG